MGYFTFYQLSAEGPEAAEAVARVKELSGYGGSWEEEGGTEGALPQAKWYEHKDHMQTASQAFPMARLTLFCDGEDGTQWYVYALGGQALQCDSVRVFEPNTLWAKSA